MICFSTPTRSPVSWPRGWSGRTATPPDQDARTRKAEARLEELTRQRDRLTDAYQTGALALDPFRTRMQALEENRVAVELALAEIKTEHLEVELVRSRALGAQEVVSTLRAKLLDADFDTQQTILRLLVERVVVNGQSLEIHLALPVSSNSALTSKPMKEGDGADVGIGTVSRARISERGPKARRKMRSTAPAIVGLWCRKGRMRFGTESTH